MGERKSELKNLGCVGLGMKIWMNLKLAGCGVESVCHHFLNCFMNS